MTRSFAAFLIVLALGVAGCASEPEDAATTASPEAAATTAPTPTGSPADEQGDLADGRHAVFIKSVDVADRSLEVDVVQFLTGDEATEAYRDETGESDDPPNDYYIKNENTRLRTLEVSDDAALHVTGLGSDAVDKDEVTLEQLADYVDERKDSPFWLELEDGVVVDAEEQYVP